MTTIITRKPIVIDRDVTRSCVQLQNCCGEKGIPDKPVVIRIKKAGTCTPIIEYDGHVEGDTLCFDWDNLLWDLCGRYTGDIYEADPRCGDGHIDSIAFEINADCWQATQIADNQTHEDTPDCDPPDCDCDALH